jgi:ribosomal protein S18 acetylase RimI-like enzyme
MTFADAHRFRGLRGAHFLAVPRRRASGYNRSLRPILVPQYDYSLDLHHRFGGAVTRIARPAKAVRRASARALREAPAKRAAIDVRDVRRADLDAVIAIDAAATNLPKPAYWRSVFRRYGDPDERARHFLVAAANGEVVGFVVGEVRDWEFGSPPCGWVFGIDVRADAREAGVGSQLLDAMAKRFRRAGVTKLRTMLARDNTLILSFFRSQGMTAAPFIPLEMDLD